jgi:hypothetical protein
MVPFHPAHGVRAHRPWRFRPQVWELEGRVVPGFLAPVNYSVEGGLNAVAVGDFNRDGILDLAATNGVSSGTVSVLLGNGDGSFQTAGSYAAGIFPTAVAVGDFNGDGILDLAVANGGDRCCPNNSSVSVLLGNGDGSFQPPMDLAGGGDSVAVGDFNGDQILDLAVANYDRNNVSVLLGNGDGTFQTAVSYRAGDHPSFVAVADLNRDGILDLAVVNAGEDYSGPPGTVSVLLGNGDGSFQAAMDSGADYGPNSVAVGDFNGDGIPDLAVAGYGNSAIGYGDQSIRVLLGNGNGSFDKDFLYYVSRFDLPSSVAAADFNGDGVLDLVFATRDPYVGVLLGNGDGSFQGSMSYRASRANTNTVAVGDFNGDGWPDVATGSYTGSGVVSIALNDGNWGGGSPRRPAAPDRPRLAPGVAPAGALPPTAILPSDFGATGRLSGPSAILPVPEETAPVQTSVPALPPLAPPSVQNLVDQVLPTPAPAAETVTAPDGLPTVALDGPIRLLAESL